MALYTLDGMAVGMPNDGSAWVAPNAVLVGHVVLEANTTIWFNAVLRGDNEIIRIGAGSNVQDGCVLHTDPGFPLSVGRDCTIGHMVMLHGCTIGRGSLVGIGAIVLNGAEIGEESLVGAGALIPEGKKYPPRSVIMGAPGRVVRTVTDADLERISSGVASYQHNGQRFRAGMKPQAG
jgi:carbonic anhydrase/acetyltransferase-like protein (isoleucine patch superfamily)